MPKQNRAPFGGKPGAKAETVLLRDGEAISLSSKEVRELKRGDIISYRLAGAGGYGDPRERNPDAVKADVIDGFISRATAANVYGTAVD